MKIEKRTIGDVVVLDIKGMLSQPDSAKKLQKRVDKLISNGQVRILLNMSGCPLVDACGVGELIRSHRATMRAAGELKFFGLQEKIQQLFKIVKVAEVFTTYEDERAAVKSFK